MITLSVYRNDMKNRDVDVDVVVVNPVCHVRNPKSNLLQKKLCAKLHISKNTYSN